EDGIREFHVTGVQTCALPIYDATVYGIELNYSQNLNFLPAPWDGLVVGANATFSSTDATIEEQAVARDISFPNQSDQVGNLSIRSEERRVGKECRSHCCVQGS